jgi:Fic family protein
VPQTRTYERTHPWIRFDVRLRDAPPALWLLLGEAQSKCEHVAGVPLRPETAERLYRVFLAKGVAATTAIEGNTLSADDVLRRIEGNLELPPSKEYLGRSVDNILKACNGLMREIVDGSVPPVSVERIRQFNRMVLDGLALPPEIAPGELRHHSVEVANYRGAPHEDCAYLLERLCDWLESPALQPRDAGHAIVHAIVRAVLAHLYLAWIHPFGDGNGRTARLVELQILVRAGVPAAAAHLLSNHYNATRAEYCRQLDRASASGGEIVPFLQYAVTGFVDGLRDQLAVIREQQWTAAWRDWVDERLPDRASPTDVRRRNLVLALSARREPVPLRQLPELDARVAAAYARKTARTLARDRNALLDLGLIREEPGGYVANREIILAFLPPRMARPPATSPESL